MTMEPDVEAAVTVESTTNGSSGPSEIPPEDVETQGASEDADKHVTPEDVEKELETFVASMTYQELKAMKPGDIYLNLKDDYGWKSRPGADWMVYLPAGAKATKKNSPFKDGVHWFSCQDAMKARLLEVKREVERREGREVEDEDLGREQPPKRRMRICSAKALEAMAYSPKRKKKRGSSDARSSTASADGASEMDGAFNFSEVGGSKADGEQTKQGEKGEVDEAEALAAKLVEMSTNPAKRAGVHKISELLQLTDVYRSVVRNIQDAAPAERHDTALALAKTLIPLRDSIKQALTSIQPNTESEKESAPSTA